MQDTQTFTRLPRWTWSLPSQEYRHALRLQRRWRWPTLGMLLLTIPAFYVDLLPGPVGWLARLTYGLAGLCLAAAMLHVGRHMPPEARYWRSNLLEWALISGLLLAALLPTSHDSTWSFGLRLGVAFLSLLRITWSVMHLVTHGSMGYVLSLAATVLVGCGVGFWWLEPTAHTLGDGLWLAFTTAATVGYGDLVPTTDASKIFSVFVVLLGYSVLSLVTAAIAAHWVGTEERRAEREMLHDLRRELAGLRQDIQALRAAQSERSAPDQR